MSEIESSCVFEENEEKNSLENEVVKDTPVVESTMLENENQKEEEEEVTNVEEKEEEKEDFNSGSESENDSSDYEGDLPFMYFEDEYYHGVYAYEFQFLLEDTSHEESVPNGYTSEDESVYSLERNKDMFYRQHEDQRQYYLEDDLEDDSDNLVFTKELSQFIFGFHKDYQVLSVLQNSVNRKIYLVYEFSTAHKRVISVCRDDPSLSRHPDTNEPREVYIMRKLVGCEGVAQILGWCNLSPCYYAILTPFYPSIRTMSQYLSILPKNLACYFIASFMKRLLSSIASIHERKVIHRDICWENICYDPIEDKLVLIDFGASSLIRPKMYRDIGRFSYYAPEITKTINSRKRVRENLDKFPKRRKLYERKRLTTNSKDSYNESVDVWSAGIMLYSLIFNQCEEPELKDVRKNVRKFENKNEHKTSKIKYLLCNLLKHDPSERQTAAELSEIASKICDIEISDMEVSDMEVSRTSSNPDEGVERTPSEQVFDQITRKLRNSIRDYNFLLYNID